MTFPRERSPRYLPARYATLYGQKIFGFFFGGGLVGMGRCCCVPASPKTKALTAIRYKMGKTYKTKKQIG